MKEVQKVNTHQSLPPDALNIMDACQPHFWKLPFWDPRLFERVFRSHSINLRSDTTQHNMGDFGIVMASENAPYAAECHIGGGCR